tara:strand:+ start:194 stop:616 length:423 start_codon:yes stop_codon:yes gene_type:complete
MRKCGVYSDSDGAVRVVHPSDTSISDSDLKTMVKELSGADCKVMDAADLPGRAFRGAWKATSSAVSVDVGKAKDITHAARRAARDREMAPFDVKVTIPDESSAAEAERVKLRKKYAALQTKIDASDESNLNKIIDDLKTG